MLGYMRCHFPGVPAEARVIYCTGVVGEDNGHSPQHTQASGYGRWALPILISYEGLELAFCCQANSISDFHNVKEPDPTIRTQLEST